jgi:hypothetical protein
MTIELTELTQAITRAQKCRGSDHGLFAPWFASHLHGILKRPWMWVQSFLFMCDTDATVRLRIDNIGLLWQGFMGFLSPRITMAIYIFHCRFSLTESCIQHTVPFHSIRRSQVTGLSNSAKRQRSQENPENRPKNASQPDFVTTV